METSDLVLSEFCDVDLLLPPPQPEKPKQTIKIELINKPIFFIVQPLPLNDPSLIHLRVPAKA
jgi:hypothetical protein